MTRDELISDFRAITQDKVEPFLFETADVARWLADAEAEAAIRGRLLHESQDARVCERDVTAGEAGYALHPALYEITHIGFKPTGATRREHLRLVSTEGLDRTVADWRDLTGPARYAIQGDTSLRLVPAPDQAGTLYLEGYRVPLKSLAESKSSTPEIHQGHHRHLVHWALYRAFSTPDAETLDLGKAADAERDFTAYFGARPDSNLRRITREDGPQTNKVFFP